MIPFNATAVGGPIGVVAFPKMEIISPAATGTGHEAGTIGDQVHRGHRGAYREAHADVRGARRPAHARYRDRSEVGPPALTPLGSTDTARLNEPLFGVAHGAIGGHDGAT